MMDRVHMSSKDVILNTYWERFYGITSTQSGPVYSVENIHE